MKKILTVMAVLVFGFAMSAYAEVLSDAQMAGLYAGQFDVQVDGNIAATGSSVADQKNIASVGSLEGSVSAAAVSNVNAVAVTNIGDSAVSSQLNIAALAGMGLDLDNADNSISNSNDATVDNIVDPNMFGSVDGSAMGTMMDGGLLASNSISAQQSAISMQTNIGAMVTEGNALNTAISNVNTATVSQSTAV